MDISVIVCTYNRSQQLKQCLGSLEKQIVPEGLSWEVLVVDNNSTDDIKKFIEEFKKSTILNIRYEFEEKLGVSFARNTGCREANGNIILFIDSDAVADSNWLKNIIKPINEYDADCVGGKILPQVWPTKKPKWLTKELYSYIGIYNKGEEAVELDFYIDVPFSGNMAFKKTTFNEIGQFNVSLGRVGTKSTFGGEEQDWERKLLDKGRKIFYQPDAIVYHPLRPEMLTKKYLRTMDFHTGEKNALLFFGEYNKRNIFGIPLFIFNQFFRSVIRYIVYIIKHGYNNSFRQELYCWYFLGFMFGRVKYWSGHK